MPEPKTFGEALDRLGELQDKTTVYKELIGFLTPMISTDSHQPEKGIMSPRVANAPIDEGIVLIVQKELAAKVAEMDKESTKLRGLAVAAKKAAIKKKATKKPPQRRRK